ncbi:MAG: hypothetical protein JKY02_05435 [Flavobacteriaceae bacterium]|nr:hypothetical protein [Flavobacteriaceae bacterium]
MKKNSLILFVLFISIFTSNAQELGLRFGDVSGGNVAIDAVLSMGENNRIHADVSFGNGIGIDLVWDFIYEPLGDEELHWYAGLGPYAFLGSPFQLGTTGELGLEYRFKNTPLVLGVDWRPYLRVIDNTDFGVDSFGLNVRWVF